MSLQGRARQNCFSNSQAGGTFNWNLGLWVVEQFDHWPSRRLNTSGAVPEKLAPPDKKARKLGQIDN